jgi:hypothetical protein
MVTYKYMAYPFVGKLVPESSGQVRRKPESFASDAKFSQWIKYLWSSSVNGMRLRV